MGTSPSESEIRKALLESLEVTPDQIASYVNTLLDNADNPPTQWDRLCFAVEYIGLVSVNIDVPQMTAIAKQMAAIVYQMHITHNKALESCLTQSSKSSAEIPTGSEIPKA